MMTIARLLLLLLIPFSVSAGPAAYIRHNLAGYLPDDSKIALVLAHEPLKGGYTLLEIPSGKTVFRGNLTPASGKPWQPFQQNYEINFTSFKEKGRFLIRLERYPDVQSVVITIGSYPAYQNQLVTFMQQQRCGYNPYTKQVCHQHDGKSFYNPALKDSSYVDATGGWHDAGDQLKYLITSSNATARLLFTYQQYKTRFKTDRIDEFGHPHANGIPDILDEAKWGLDWIHKLHPRPDWLYHQVADDRDHRGFKYPHLDNANYGWGANSYRPVYFATGAPQGLGKYQSEATGVANLAGRCAAAMAMASKVWREDLKDTIFAARCLSAAKSLYALGKKKEGYQQGNHHGERYRYYEDTWADDMEWGAAELFKATGQAAYLDDAKRYARMSGNTSWMEKDTADHYQLYPYVNLGHYSLFGIADEATKKELAAFYKSNLSYVTEKGKKNPYGVGVPFIWCSNNLVTAFVTQAILYEQMTGDKQFRSAALAHRDWLLGRNPWGTSMFTALPAYAENPLDVHLPFWALDKKTFAGGLVDGPLWQTIHGMMRSIKLNEPDEFAEFQPPHVKYHDDIGDYSTNEPTMDGTADAILMMAWLNGG